MCGIVGYIGKRAALPIILNGISRLDYRGYDSAGFTVMDKTFKTFKSRGRIADLRRIIKDKTTVSMP